MLMFPSLLIIDKVQNEKEEDQGGKNIERHTQLETLITLPTLEEKWKKEIFITLEWAPKVGDQEFIMYKEVCSLCQGNGYITIVVKGQDEIKQCWLCESKGENVYSQAQVDDFIYKMYYQKGKPNAVWLLNN